MSEPVRMPRRLAAGLVLTCVVGVGLNVFTLLLLPQRVEGRAVPIAHVAVFFGNAALGHLVSTWLRTSAPAKVLTALAFVLPFVAVSSGPGGDLLVTRDLQVSYLAYLVAALVGALLPLLRGRYEVAASP